MSKATHSAVRRMVEGLIVARGNLPSTSKLNTSFSAITAPLRLVKKEVRGEWGGSVLSFREGRSIARIPCKALYHLAFNDHDTPLVTERASSHSIRLHRARQHISMAVIPSNSCAQTDQPYPFCCVENNKDKIQHRELKI